jgi:hypothetical protein
VPLEEAAEVEAVVAERVRLDGATDPEKVVPTGMVRVVGI